MTKDVSLKPCPFCGSDQVGLSKEWYNSRLKSVGCQCGASGPSYSKQADATSAWNRRAVL